MRRPRFAVLATVLLASLASCAPVATAFNSQSVPVASDLGPKNAQLEWWYVSGYLPESQLAFHWAQFRVNYKGVPYNTAHVAVTDLSTGNVTFLEQNSPDTAFKFPPLSVRQGDWKLQETSGKYALSAGPLQLNLVPEKPAVVHPPGYSGNAEVGRMYYQSITRLALSGTVAGKPAAGTAWLDHQWGDQLPGQGALWDWFGLHLDNGVDLMVYRVKNTKGRVVQLAGSWVDQAGVARAVQNFQATPHNPWRSPSGREYALNWDLRADNFNLYVGAVHQNQELLSNSTRVAYWEGPVAGGGSFGGRAVKVEGMGEFVGGSLGGIP